MSREIHRALAFGAGVLKDIQVRGDQVGEGALVKAGEHPLVHGLGRDPEQGAD